MHVIAACLREQIDSDGVFINLPLGRSIATLVPRRGKVGP